MADANPKQIKDFFGYESITAFAAGWKALSEEDKAHLRAGIGDGTLTY
jgi:hypothetical protein